MEVTVVQLDLVEGNKGKCESVFSTNFNPEIYNEKLLDSWIKASGYAKKFAKSISVTINQALCGDLLPSFEDLYNRSNGVENRCIWYILESLAPIFENEEFRDSFFSLSMDLRMNLVDLFLDAVIEDTILPEISFFWKSFGFYDGNIRDLMLMSNETVSTEDFSRGFFGRDLSVLNERAKGITSVGFGVEDEITEKDFEKSSVEDTVKGEIITSSINFVNYKSSENKYNDCFNLDISEDNIILFHYTLLFGINRFILSYVLGVFGISYMIGIDNECTRGVFVSWYTDRRNSNVNRCEYENKNEGKCCENTEYIHKLTFDYFLESINRKYFEKSEGRRLELVINKYKERVYSLFSDNLPVGFEKALEIYLSELLTYVSKEMLNLIITGDIKESDFIQIGYVGLKRELFKQLGKHDFNQEKGERFESYISRLDCFQNIYEDKFSRFLGLNGSYGAIDFEIFVYILKFVVSWKNSDYLDGRIEIDSDSACLHHGNLTKGLSEIEGLLRNISKRHVTRSKLKKDVYNGNNNDNNLDCDVDNNELGNMMDNEKEKVYFGYSEENEENANSNRAEKEDFNVNELYKNNLLILGGVIKLLFGSDIDNMSIYNYINKENDLSPMDFIGNLNKLAGVIGLGETWKVVSISTLRSHAAKVVLLLEKQKFKESSLRIYSNYIHNYLGPLLQVFLEGGICLTKERIGEEWNRRNHELKRFYEELYMEYAWNLKRRLIYFILAFPDNKKDNIDLFGMINSFPSSDILKEHWYSEISRDIQNYVLKQFLEPHLDTYDILGFYVKGIFFLLKLDVPKEWINRALGKLGDTLRQRNDTTQCIIGWMPFLLENSSMEETEPDLVIPITCSDEGIYPQFSIIEPNYRNEGRNVFTRLKDTKVSRSKYNLKGWGAKYSDNDCFGDHEYNETNNCVDIGEDDMWVSDITDIRIENCINKPPIKLVLEWISRIYGNNLTLLHDFINNFAQRVLGNSLEIGFESMDNKIPNSTLIDEKHWVLDEGGLKRDESIYELIKLTVGRHNGENIRGGIFETLGEGCGSGGVNNKNKDEQQLFSHCNVIIQDIVGSIQDNREYSSRNKSYSMLNNDCQVVTGITLSRSYWSGALNVDIREDCFPLASVLDNEINEYRKFFELEHPGRTFTCYPCYGNVEADLTALDMSVKSGVKMNFLQVSIYEYLSEGSDRKSSFEFSERNYDKGSGGTNSLIISNSNPTTSSLLNWFALSPKSSEKQISNENSGLSARYKDVSNEFTVCLEELVKHFGLDEETIRWNLESMVSRGLITVKLKEDKEQFGIPETFDVIAKQRKEGDNDVGLDQNSSQVKSTAGFGINDMTVMLDFSTLVNGIGNENAMGKKEVVPVDKNKKQFDEMDHDDVVLFDKLSNCKSVSDHEDDSDIEQDDTCYSEVDEEDFNLNFPTGMLTSTINTGKTKDSRCDTGVYQESGGTKSGIGAGGTERAGIEAEKGVRVGTESGKVSAILPPFIDTSETYLEKCCYFNTPIILERPKESEKNASQKGGSQKKSDSGKYDIIRECELLIRGMLQINGPMAPAVLFGRVRTAMANQRDEKSKTAVTADETCNNTGDSVKNNATGNEANDLKETLTWSHHVQAINNMVDRGEACNKGGRLFLEK
ncbi:cullin domain containing [Cryptosporidium bovis]|uniref:cullin domain containing n=1 Tax=Cryptosporidium bovis TaxID=310047 RepID=UPI00351A3819|nr:cullin domain containing [Cryptosporidium bovis]